MNYKVLGRSITMLVPLFYLYILHDLAKFCEHRFTLCMGDPPKGKISASSIHTNILQEVVGRLLVK